MDLGLLLGMGPLLGMDRMGRTGRMVGRMIGRMIGRMVGRMIGRMGMEIEI